MAEIGTQWRHKKRGGIYSVVANDARLQCSSHPALETALGGVPWTIYCDVATGKMYLRPTREFEDGRFERHYG